MQNYNGIPTPTAPPHRNGIPFRLIVLFVVILAAVVAAGIFALRGYQQLQAMAKDTFLFTVASHDTVEVKKLLDANPSLVNAVGTFEVSPLGYAAGGGDIAMMKLLIARKADVNGRAHDAYSPLHESAASGQTEAAKLLLAKGAKIDARTDSGFTPLYLAAMMGKKEVAEVLIAHGANVNAKANDGSTPLKRALKQLAKLNLLSPKETAARKAQIERDKKQGRPIFERPTAEHCRQVIDCLRQHGGKE